MVQKTKSERTVRRASVTLASVPFSDAYSQPYLLPGLTRIFWELYRNSDALAPVPENWRELAWVGGPPFQVIPLCSQD